MRHRLYRAKTKNNNNWVKGYYLEQQYTTYCIKSDYDAYPDNSKHYIVYDWLTDWGLPNKHIFDEVWPETVGQCVGHVDRNNIEIFEGDIIRVTSMFVPFENNIFVVEWCSDWAGFVLINSFTVYGFDTVDSDDMEIIGNIHDNPKLFRCCGIEEESSEEVIEKV